MRYASPEDLDEDADVGPPSDVYSLGATLLHLAHGAPPTLKDRLAPWDPPPTDDPDLQRLDAVIASCLQPAPAARPSAAEVLDRLESIDWTLATRCRALPVEPPPALVSAAAPAPVSSASTSPPGASAASAAAAPIMSFDDGPAGADPVVPDGHDTSARTIERPDRIAPPPRPSAVSPRRRWPWVAAAVLGAALVGVIVALLWPNDADAPAGPVNTELPVTTVAGATTAPPTSTPPEDPAVAVEAVDRPDALADIDGDDIVWPFGEVGGCLVLVDGATELTPVDCDDPHDLQRFAVDELDANEFPTDTQYDADAVVAATDDACRQAFETLVGVADDTSQFEIAVTRPSETTWADGDRRFQCLLGVQGQWLVGDAESSTT